MSKFPTRPSARPDSLASPRLRQTLGLTGRRSRRSRPAASGASRRPTARSKACSRPGSVTPAAKRQIRATSRSALRLRPRRGGRGVVRPRPGQLRPALADVLAHSQSDDPQPSGWDVASQYRSAIFVHDDDQAALAAASSAREQQATAQPIATEITPAGPFYETEEYPPQYFEKQGRRARALTLP
jgi:hypothetical protein